MNKTQLCRHRHRHIQLWHTGITYRQPERKEAAIINNLRSPHSLRQLSPGLDRGSTVVVNVTESTFNFVFYRRRILGPADKILHGTGLAPSRTLTLRLGGNKSKRHWVVRWMESAHIVLSVRNRRHSDTDTNTLCLSWARTQAEDIMFATLDPQG